MVLLLTPAKVKQKLAKNLAMHRLHMVLGGPQEILQAKEIQNREFSSIDEVIAANNKVMRKRGKGIIKPVIGIKLVLDFFKMLFQ